jgi:hypothetical protein
METITMRRRQFTTALLALSSLGAGGSVRSATLTESDAAAGVRAALQRGALSAVGLLGRTDGFLGNPQVRIPLPSALEQAATLLKVLGQQQKVDELVTAMNRAAEAAVPEAKPLLVNAVKNMSVEDAMAIVRGGDTSVTEFFAGKTREPLGEKFLPIVTRATQRVALAEKYNAVAAKATSLGIIKSGEADVQHYVTAKALDGLYLMIGEEEKKIRRDPVGTGSAILKKVFGSLK